MPLTAAISSGFVNLSFTGFVNTVRVTAAALSGLSRMRTKGFVRKLSTV
jgi:hypothetical protein